MPNELAILFLATSIQSTQARSNRCRLISRNRTLRTPFLRLIFDDGWKDLEERACRLSFKREADECFLLPNVQWIVTAPHCHTQKGPNGNVLSSYSEDLMDSCSNK
jgi:hypothetical protein